MAGIKGRRLPNSGKGRIKGSQNKVTRAFKEAVLVAFHAMGGTAALTDWGRKNPTEFYKTASRLIPTEHNVSGGDGLPVRVIHEHLPG